MTEVDLTALLDSVDESVITELASMPDVVNEGDSLDLSALKIDKREWHLVEDVVAVAADLKSSTRIGLNKKPASTASIYEASTGGVVDIFGEFDADFIDIQGDGAFALFWGDKRLERAVCAGITVKTFSELSLVKRLTAKWPDDLPETGLKVGIAVSPLLVKRVGIPRTDHQEPVWAGNAVNYATKAAQHADRHQMIVTGSVWDWISKNDYFAVSCPCSGTTASLWQDVRIGNMPGDDGERDGKLLSSLWCVNHGAAYCDAVLAGESVRSDAHHVVEKAMAAEAKNSIRLAAAARRRDVRARRRGLSNR